MKITRDSVWRIPPEPSTSPNKLLFTIQQTDAGTYLLRNERYQVVRFYSTPELADAAVLPFLKTLPSLPRDVTIRTVLQQAATTQAAAS